MKKLSNNQMRRFVARLFKKDDLAVEGGKVTLTEEEKAEVVKTYGQAFLDKLLAPRFSLLDKFLDELPRKSRESHGKRPIFQPSEPKRLVRDHQTQLRR